MRIAESMALQGESVILCSQVSKVDSSKGSDLRTWLNFNYLLTSGKLTPFDKRRARTTTYVHLIFEAGFRKVNHSARRQISEMIIKGIATRATKAWKVLIVLNVQIEDSNAG